MKTPPLFYTCIIVISLSGLILLGACSKDEVTELLPVNDTPGWIKDVEGNTYTTIRIGNQIWMAENLRVSKYNNGDPVPAGLGPQAWLHATTGASAIYPYVDLNGIHSEAETVNAYGRLYNWYAVTDARGLCPAGYRVPANEDWLQLIDYVVNQYHWSTDPEDTDGIGNRLKSCRQMHSPAGGDCDTEKHPRWAPHSLHFGKDALGFAALPGGGRSYLGGFDGAAFYGGWWTTTRYSDNRAYFYRIELTSSGFFDDYTLLQTGHSVRCVRNVD